MKQIHKMKFPIRELIVYGKEFAFLKHHRGPIPEKAIISTGLRQGLWGLPGYFVQNLLPLPATGYLYRHIKNPGFSTGILIFIYYF